MAATSAPAPSLRGASSYTPYDATAMMWARSDSRRQMLWVNSGADAGKLLESSANPAQRPDWILCSQGVVAALAARGESPVIIATVHRSPDSLLPLFRKPVKPIKGSRTLIIPRSSIDFAFSNLMKREGVSRMDVQIPQVEKADFSLISSLLGKPAGDPNALDFAILVEPFITNVMTESPGAFDVGKGGVYDLHYSVVVRREDLQSRRADFVKLLRELLAANLRLQGMPDVLYFEELWGRQKGGRPEVLPRLFTYHRDPAGMGLDAAALRGALRDELQYLTSTYPQDLRMPDNVDALVDETLFREVAPDRLK
ncbi:MAG TPA: hypothetical protein VF701_04065 [Thermoanaerobaculia bacterium]